MSRPRVNRSPLRRNLCASTWDGTLAGGMIGVGEAYFPAFVLALGYGDVASGLVASAPPLLGSVLQLVTPAVVRRVGSYKKWVVACALIKPASFLPLAAGAVTGHMSLAAVFLVVTFYFAFGYSQGPAWSSWVGRLFPARVRAAYFARRSPLCQLGWMLGSLVAGLIIGGGRRGEELYAYGLVFLLAGALRAASGGFLSLKSDATPREGIGVSDRDVPLAALVGRLRSGNDARLLAYLFFSGLAIQVSTPFLNAYFLGPLRLEYTQYVLLISAVPLAKIVATPLMGILVRRWGSHAMLWAGAVAVVPIPLLLLMWDSFAALLVVQLVSGMLLAGYELANLLMLFEAIPHAERTSVMTRYCLVNSLATFLGSLVGARILGSAEGVGDGVQAAVGGVAGAACYEVVFAVSLGLRLAAVLLAVRVRKGEGLPGVPATVGGAGGPGTLGPPISDPAPQPRREAE